MDIKAKYWVELSDYDYDTALAMLDTKRYPYVGFMFHQTTEKVLKAYWSDKITKPPIKTHHLSRLAAQSGIADEMSEEQMDFIDRLEPLNIEARYPAYKARLLSALTHDYCKQLLKQTDELRQWIRSKL